jgi:vacuolar-type H+-ATPase subunit F/Vma7
MAAMSKLLVITRPELVYGFRLAGVSSFSAIDVETAAEFIEGLLAARDSYLLAIDDALLDKMDPSLLHRLETSDQIQFLAIPGGQNADEILFRHRRISELTRRTVGFHSVFKTEKPETKAK